jgi:UDP-glucose 4-epimerase
MTARVAIVLLGASKRRRCASTGHGRGGLHRERDYGPAARSRTLWIVLDNSSRGHRDAVAQGATLIEGDLLDSNCVLDVLARERVAAVVHMAASSLVGESMTAPERYYRNNVIASLGLLDAMNESGVKLMVLSSTAAVYGEPQKQPITEADPTAPSNAYGETKLTVERAMFWHHRAHGLRYASLRYFNAAGAQRQHAGNVTIPKRT